MPLPLAPLGEPDVGEKLETDACFDDECTYLFSQRIYLLGAFIWGGLSFGNEWGYTFYGSAWSHSCWVFPCPHFPILSPSYPSVFHPCLAPPMFTFIGFEIFVFDSYYLDQTLDSIDIERLEYHIEVEGLTWGHPIGIDFHITFDWFCLRLLPSRIRNSGLYFEYMLHSRCFMHDSNHIICRPLTCV